MHKNAETVKLHVPVFKSIIYTVKIRKMCKYDSLYNLQQFYH